MRDITKNVINNVGNYANAMIGRNIKLYRQLSNLKQDQVAKFFSVTKAAISAIERGVNNVTIQQAILFAVLYNCKVGDLINTENLDGLKMMLEKDLKAARNQQDNNKTTEN